jgi:alkylmercury lyase
MLEKRVDQIAEGWKKAKEELYTAEYALVFRALLQTLLLGSPVSMETISAKTGMDEEDVATVWQSLLETGASSNLRNEITGATLSLAPSSTIFEVGDNALYAWCALDAIFLPAFLGENATVRTLSPKTGEEIQLEIGPDGIHSSIPEGAVLSIDVPNLDAGKSGAACALNHMFANTDKAENWVGDRESIAILSLDEAWKVVKSGWIDPFNQALMLAEKL